ncbi:hypothetical protein CC79DRAFT_1329145 [Sarocladium strictum]|jgi:hypothetical protein
MGLRWFSLVLDAPHLCSALLLRDTRESPAPAASLFDTVNIKSCVVQLGGCQRPSSEREGKRQAKDNVKQVMAR